MKETLNRPITLHAARTPKIGVIFVTGIAIGAALTYLFEPRFRSRRQAILRDKTFSFARRSVVLGGKFSRHIRNRLQGLVAVTSDLMMQEGLDSDSKIEARVRSALGRASKHAHTITVAVNDGRVSLRGPLAAHEAGVVVRATERVRGVKRVENFLTPPLSEGTSPMQ